MSGQGYGLKDFQNDPYYQGFVYLITNKLTNRKYIGKKTFWFKRKNKTIMSDWLNYFGSNKELLDDVKKFGSENFTRDILRLCKTKSELSYFEAKYQFQEDVLIRDDYYNQWIMIRIRKSNLIKKPFI